MNSIILGKVSDCFLSYDADIRGGFRVMAMYATRNWKVETSLPCPSTSFREIPHDADNRLDFPLWCRHADQAAVGCVLSSPYLVRKFGSILIGGGIARKTKPTPTRWRLPVRKLRRKDLSQTESLCRLDFYLFILFIRLFTSNFTVVV